MHRINKKERITSCSAAIQFSYFSQKSFGVRKWQKTVNYAFLQQTKVTQLSTFSSIFWWENYVHGVVHTINKKEQHFFRKGERITSCSAKTQFTHLNQKSFGVRKSWMTVNYANFKIDKNDTIICIFHQCLGWKFY